MSRILIDGDYLLNTQGTGISSYAKAVASALRGEGHSVSWISGAASGGKTEPLTDSVGTFDQPAPARGLREKLETLKSMASGLAHGSVQAREVEPAGTIIHPNAAEAGAGYVAPDVFRTAHYRHMLIRQFTEIRTRTKFDIFHLTTPLPVRMEGVTNIVSIHDIIPIRLPYTTLDNKSEYIDRVRTCASRARLILTLSEATKNDLIEVLKIPEDRIRVTYISSTLPAMPAQEQPQLPHFISRFGLQVDNYALFVGALEPKKNIETLMRAILDLPGDMPLVIVGRKAWMYEPIFELYNSLDARGRNRIKFLSYVPQHDLSRLYAGAKFFVFPSLYEGFGLPALDAMRLGCPVVTSNKGSLPEVCGEAALYADPFDREQLRDQIALMDRDAGLREKLRAAGRRQALLFSEEAFAARLSAAYAEL